MVEGWARAVLDERAEAQFAGTWPQGLHPLAARFMREAGVDISGPAPTSVDSLGGGGFDRVVTVCDAAAEACPVFSAGVRTIHHSVGDPPRPARDARNDDEALRHSRRVRDGIKECVERLPQLWEGVHP
jgi:arsenate reductase